MATYSPALSRDGPGLLLRDIQAGTDEQVAAAVAIIAAADADVLLLTDIDWDHDGLALSALADLLAQRGTDYPHRFAGQPNAGVATGLDLDGDGRLGRAADAQGFGFFTGQGGMALLSRLPLGEVRDFSAVLWKDVPGNLMPQTAPEVAAVQRLSSVAHWDVPVRVGSQWLHLLVFSATPPVFDGPEDRNGRRNHDELAFWAGHDRAQPFVVLGKANLDPEDGEGRREIWPRLLQFVQDPGQSSAGGARAPQLGANATQQGNPARDTAVYASERGPGNLRVDVVLPGSTVKVLDSGVLWPADGQPLASEVARASRHRLVWADLDLP